MKSMMLGDPVSTTLRRKWTDEEDELLKAAVNRYDEQCWKLIANEVPGRNHVQCLQRWKKVLKPGLVKGHWTNEEDERLKQIVKEGYKNWGDVAARIEGRTAKQCRERWSCNLDPKINKGKWKKSEDEMITQLQSMVGNRWSLMAKRLPGRTENAIKTRAKSLARAKKKAWTAMEDKIIYDSKVSAPTPNTRASAWAKIAEKLPGRSKNAVKKRWKELRQQGYNGKSTIIKEEQKICSQESLDFLSVSGDSGTNSNSHMLPNTQISLTSNCLSDLSEAASSVSSSCNSHSSIQNQFHGHVKETVVNQEYHQRHMSHPLPQQTQNIPAPHTKQFGEGNIQHGTNYQNYISQPSFGNLHPSPTLMQVGSQSPLDHMRSSCSPFNSAFNAANVAASVGSQFSHLPSSFASQVSLSPQYMVPGIQNTAVSPAMRGQYVYQTQANPCVHATPPVIVHHDDDNAEMMD